eukprot:TRINITY_DN14583_c0_g2_i1.p1 TRINITY_DN14583_c0_g2~~TRINITY_DN14583_c0_g2_i1.p1  ORF type:complete len:159 (+),score=24.36 TRINITY_DN14583_c0_g2_i1:185-661(+)
MPMLCDDAIGRVWRFPRYDQGRYNKNDLVESAIAEACREAYQERFAPRPHRRADVVVGVRGLVRLRAQRARSSAAVKAAKAAAGAVSGAPSGARTSPRSSSCSTATSVAEERRRGNAAGSAASSRSSSRSAAAATEAAAAADDLGEPRQSTAVLVAAK